MAQIPHEWLCVFSIVRYVADPIRSEAKNIGAIVLCPDQHYGAARFRLRNAGISQDSPTYAMLQALVEEYGVSLPGYGAPARASLPGEWTRAELEHLHRECTNLVQFSAPSAALGDPVTLLDDLYRERVLPRRSDVGEQRSRAVRVAVRTLRDALQPLGKSEWVHAGKKSEAGGEYPFDITVRNGRLYYALETLSFQAARAHSIEEHGAWYAKRWQEVHQRERYAQAVLLVEPPTDTGIADEHYRRVQQWMKEAQVQVRLLGDLGLVAREIAASLGRTG